MLLTEVEAGKGTHIQKLTYLTCSQAGQASSSSLAEQDARLATAWASLHAHFVEAQKWLLGLQILCMGQE